MNAVACAASELIEAQNITPDQSMRMRDIPPPIVVTDASQPSEYPQRAFKGRFKSDHPRILFKDFSDVKYIRKRYRTDPVYRKRVDRWTHGASAWLCTKNQEEGLKAIESLLNSSLVLPKTHGNYGNGLSMALQYDFLADHPGWTIEKRQKLNLTLRRYINQVLTILDGDSASMWHGRFTLACAGWTTAAALDIDWEVDKDMLSRIQAHFLKAIEAIELTGGWPEGYNYWINNRAYPFVLACSAHLNAVEAPDINNRIQAVLESVGLWTIYGTEPIGRFVLFGDTGPRQDLKDETQRVVDLITLATGNLVFKDYSRYIEGIHKRQGYYRGQRWGKPVFRGKPELDFTKDEILKDLSIFNERLPTSAVFGKGALGHVFIRSGWGPEDTFIFYKAGHTFTHHGHYQAGHFTITKKAPLAITSGTYSHIFSPHRLNYYIRTVAANSLLILKPGEAVKPNRFFTETVSDGGQRIVIPTGSAIVSVKDWEKNLYKGKHYEGGIIKYFDNSSQDYVYVDSDLTGAYNNRDYDDNKTGGKVSRVTRQVVYLNNEDILIVHDRVTATDGSYTKKWLLHSWSKPKTKNEDLLAGSPADGILETRDDTIFIEYGGAVLQVKKLFPRDGVIRKIGGLNYRYYVETDGDDSDIDGANIAGGSKELPWFDYGLWRMEIQPEPGRKFDRFLVVIKPEIGSQGNRVRCRRLEFDKIVGVITDRSVVLFGKKGLLDGIIDYRVPKNEADLHIIVDVPGDRNVVVKAGGKEKTVRTSKKGVLTFKLKSDFEGRIRVLMDVRS